MRSFRPLPVKAVLSVILIVALVFGFSLSGCASTPDPTPTPTKTPTPTLPPLVTATPVVPSVAQSQPTTTPTVPPTPTEKPPDPTATQTPTTIPTASPTPVEPATETPAPEETPTTSPANTGSTNETDAKDTPNTPVPSPTPATAASGATDINPLTGLPVAAYKLSRRPLGIKMPNFPPEARPQSGLSRADVVVEHEAEASLTRFTAIFWGNDVNPEVGPVRSVRLVDGELMSIFHSTLVTSGGHPAVKIRATQNKSWATGYKRIICPEEPFLGDGGTMRRVPKAGRRYELTLYSDTASLWNLSANRGINQRPDFQGMWTFDESPPEGGGQATHLKIVYKPEWAIAEYRYDAGSKTYKRFDVGQPTTDALTGQQIAPSNVVVLYANHANSDIAADTHDPNNIYYSVIIQIWGEGAGKLMRDGKVYDIKWVREDAQGAGDRLILLDGSGHKIPLRPGATWIQLVRLNGDVQID